MSDITFIGDGWDDYLYWQAQEKKHSRKSTVCSPTSSATAMTALDTPSRSKDRTVEFSSGNVM